MDDNRFNEESQTPQHVNEPTRALDEERLPHHDEPIEEHDYEEEFAAEAAIDPDTVQADDQETEMQDDASPAFGWFALSAALLSFFIAPFLLGGAGIVLGVISKRRNADTLGNMAIIIGAVSILFSLFFAPVYNLM
ncbi:hypothetical protein [Thalassobacillus sp. CUG 92003]|uniref:hypothetical protein n=1 Tax=Thalassobacillus sp. CUG 92003 TaxID=2736641 RepID=UPI0015E66EE8|nr:hypothetical protein [Thalassobacillus sp. CUG 92003]